MYVFTLPKGKGQFKAGTSYLLSDLNNFNIEQIAQSGQAFRFRKKDTGAYAVVAYDQYCEIKQLTDVNVELFCDPESLEMWLAYFDIKDYVGDVNVYAQVAQSILNSSDDVLKETLKDSGGIRILNQELLETGVAFITSSANNIPRITQLIDTLCMKYGEDRTFSGESYKTFPSAQVLIKLTEEDWRQMGFGFRAPYLVDFVRHYSQWGVDFVPTKKDLKAVKGIGDKVADCISLFSLHDLDRVPMDTWMKKFKDNLYGGTFPWDDFKPYRGICQQYMYHYYRTVKEEDNK